MILRRFAAGLRRQNWTAVAVELMVVIVGVFIGLQVDNWNDARKARAQGEVWRQQIIADLEMNARDLQARLDYNRQALAFGEVALAGLEAEQAPSGDAVWDTVLGAFQAGQIRPYRLTGPTFREVQSAGGLALVGSPQVQGELAYLYDVSAYNFDLVVGGLPKYRDMIRERLPWPIQDHIWDSGCEVVTLRPGMPARESEVTLAHCAPPPDAVLVQQALVQLRADPELQRALRGRLSQLKISTTNIGEMIEQVKTLKALLQGNAGPPPTLVPAAPASTATPGQAG